MRNQQLMNDHPLLWRGRFSRLSYLAWMGLTFILFVCVLFFDFFRLGLHSIEIYSLDMISKAFFPSIIFMIASFYPFFVFMIRRLHDLNQSGWYSLFSLVPILSFFFYLYLMFAKGQDRRNTYGNYRETPLWEGFLGLATGGSMLGAIGVTIYAFFKPRNADQSSRMLQIMLGL